MLDSLKSRVKQTALANPYIWAKGLVRKPDTQGEEKTILLKLLSRFKIPKLFVEFGFSGWEFNCAPLVFDWPGLLVDGDPYNIRIANILFPRQVTAKHLWITRETLSEVRDFVGGRDLGILSIDVDGNDYWFLERLIDLKPAMIISEYNSSFGRRPVSVPYDPSFDYVAKHPSRYYHGASLAALCHLAERNGYCLIDVTSNGVNAFFIRADLLGPDDIPLVADQAYREKYWWNGSRTSEQWDMIKHLPLVDVTAAK